MISDLTVRVAICDDHVIINKISSGTTIIYVMGIMMESNISSHNSIALLMPKTIGVSDDHYSPIMIILY
jgi:hypothetical protein